MITIDEAMLAARIMRPYYAAGLAALYPVARPGLGMVAVDKYWRLYYDPDFLQRIDIDAAATIIADHELGHLLRRHAKRCETMMADPKKFNIAGDMEINDDIPSGLPPGCIYPKTYGYPDNLMAEEYYDRLDDMPNHCQPGICGGGSGAGNPLPDELAGDNTTAPAIHEADGDEIRERVAREIIKHEKSHPGTVAGGVLVWANSSLQPPRPSDWRRLFRRSIQCQGAVIAGRYDYSWARPSRRRHTDIVFPGTIARAPRIHLLVDTSGSMFDSGPQVLGWVDKFLSSHAETKIFYGDTEFFESKNTRKIKFVGWGGTDLRPGIKLASKNADLLVVLTDGETPWPDDPPSTPTTILLLNDDNHELWSGAKKIQITRTR